MSSTTKPSNFYEILNASNTATADELKSNYKQLILQCHPDKLQQQLENTHNKLVTKNSNEAANNNSEFVAITEAWNCLKDPVKRKHYDAEQLLNKFQTHNNIYAHIKLSEMKKQLNTGEYFQDNEEEQKVMVEPKIIKESEEESETKYLYTYDCRCGGQYIVDESAEQYCGSGNHDHHHHHRETQIKSNDNNGVDDDADSTQNNKNSPNKVENNGGSTAAAVAGSEGVVFVQHNHHADDDDEQEVDDEGGELIVECSECSLVIILNG
ncbi:DPH4 homolog [Calliphora vicina]|uniref:DPH4 homolog n=1 Tax=Calliphora vicina TaxID=7373 RepID=UPI00325A65C9